MDQKIDQALPLSSSLHLSSSSSFLFLVHDIPSHYRAPLLLLLAFSSRSNLSSMMLGSSHLAQGNPSRSQEESSVARSPEGCNQNLGVLDQRTSKTSWALIIAGNRKKENGLDLFFISQ
ncbi:uncharacterized protein A4U43_C08F21890 [Asparagus officinalis]|nr:uncharacterized protein A4U43_C08F21890 [Asparagus officinalis]